MLIGNAIHLELLQGRQDSVRRANAEEVSGPPVDWQTVKCQRHKLELSESAEVFVHGTYTPKSATVCREQGLHEVLTTAVQVVCVP